VKSGEFKHDPELLSSDLTQTPFMDKILEEYSEQEKYIREKLFLD